MRTKKAHGRNVNACKHKGGEKQRMAKEIIENEQIDSTGLSDAEKAEIEAQEAKEADLFGSDKERVGKRR